MQGTNYTERVVDSENYIARQSRVCLVNQYRRVKISHFTRIDSVISQHSFIETDDL